jgi:hypothetical protein
MMRNLLAITAVFAILAGVALAEDSSVQVGAGATVKIRDQHIFPTPVFYAEPVGDLTFGTVVQVVAEQGDWFSITAPGSIHGWVHTTSLTGAILSQGSQGTDDSDMIMLAGRGFNSDVEGAYAEGKDLPWADVDKIEELTVEPSTLLVFLTEGLLLDGGTE